MIASPSSTSDRNVRKAPSQPRLADPWYLILLQAGAGFAAQRTGWFEVYRMHATSVHVSSAGAGRQLHPPSPIVFPGFPETNQPCRPHERAWSGWAKWETRNTAAEESLPPSKCGFMLCIMVSLVPVDRTPVQLCPLKEQAALRPSRPRWAFPTARLPGLNAWKVGPSRGALW